MAGTDAEAPRRPAGRPDGGVAAERRCRGRRRANVIGLGLIGGSVALALRPRGMDVQRRGRGPGPRRGGPAAGVIAAGGLDPEATITFVATPVSAIARCRPSRRWPRPAGVVTDVGSVKGAGRGRGHRPPVLRRPPDGGLGAGRARRRRRRHVRGRGLGADADRGDRRHHVRRRGPDRVGPGRRGGRRCRPSATTPWWRW